MICQVWLLAAWIAATAVAKPPLPAPPAGDAAVPEVAAAGVPSADESAERRWRKSKCRGALAPKTWLGVRLFRPTPEVIAQLPELPPGTGFVIEGLVDDGPAAAAGLEPNDVFWRMDGQILVNEAQLAVLLAMQHAGDVVKLDYFRGGRPAQAELTLGEARSGRGFEVAEDAAPVVIGGVPPGVPMHIVNVPSRSATIEHPDGRAVLTVDEDGFRVAISDPLGRTVHEGPLFRRDGSMRVPAAWRERVESLHATLTAALRKASSTRPPRIRVIPRQEPGE